jgi:hypothetical protein
MLHIWGGGDKYTQCFGRKTQEKYDEVNGMTSFKTFLLRNFVVG